MKTINGIYASATIFTTDNQATAVDEYALQQLQLLCDNETSEDSRIRVMPDVHPGKVGTIGLTMTIGKKIMPNLVGIDIGCGMTLAQIKGRKIEFQKLDAVIRDHIPSDCHIRKKAHHAAAGFDFRKLICYRHIREEQAALSLGTLGSGNHFIEADRDDDGTLYLVIHSGSRHLGKEVTEFYLNEGQKQLKTKGISAPYELTYLEGDLMEDYLHDLQIVQSFCNPEPGDHVVRTGKGNEMENRGRLFLYPQLCRCIRGDAAPFSHTCSPERRYLCPERGESHHSDQYARRHHPRYRSWKYGLELLGSARRRTHYEA